MNTTASPKTALVIGATSRIGQACITRLLALNYHVTCTTARKWEPSADLAQNTRLTCRKLNLENIDYFKIDRWMESFDLAILIPPIFVSQNFLPFAKDAGVKRLVFCSSYNTYQFGHTRAYAPLKAAEEVIMADRLNSYIVQPTMIIGHPECSATKIIWQKSKKGRAFYAVKGADAKQQPIDFRDLASALVHAATSQSLKPGRYPAAGQTVTSSHALYNQVSQVIDNPAKFITISPMIAGPATKIISALAPNSTLTAYLTRLGKDRHCTHTQLPNWTAEFSLAESLANLKQELQERA